MLRPLALDQTSSTILLSMQASQAQMARAQARLTSGYRVATPLDGPASYFAASGARRDANGLEALLDGFSLARGALRADADATDAISRLLGEMEKVRTAPATSAPPAPAPAPSPALQTDAASQTLLDATGLTLGTDVRTLAGHGFTPDSFTYAFSDGRTPVAHTWATDGWTVGDLVGTINGAGGDVTAAVNGGRLELTSAAGDAIGFRSGEAWAARAGLRGYFYDGVTGTDVIDSIAAAEALVSDLTRFDGTFTATRIDYPNNMNDNSARLGAWLDGDATGPGTTIDTNNGMYHDVILMKGQIDVAAAGTYRFRGVANDGVKVTVGGVDVFTRDGTTPNGGGNFDTTITLNAGRQDIRILYYEHRDEQGLDLRTDLTGTLKPLDTDVLSDAGAAMTFDTSLAAPPAPGPTTTTGPDAARLAELSEEIDAIVADAGVGGLNLAEGDRLSRVLNLRGTRLDTDFGRVDTSGLGLRGIDLTDADAVGAALDEAQRRLRIHASWTAMASDVLEARETFTRATIATLRTGADDLTLADTDAESARMLALQTRLDLAGTALSIAAQAPGPRHMLEIYAGLDAAS